ncbi:MAG: hypothetical protein QM645_02110 [Asticcacaulis sp.]
MMRKTIRSDRFRAIVEAYGVRPHCWPEQERQAALEFMTRHPKKAQALMQSAQETDAFLDLSRPLQPSETLHWETMARLMPGLQNSAEILAFARPSRPSRGFLLATGLGLMAACAAGMIVGINIGLMSATDMRVEEVLASSSMIDLENW